MGPLVGDSGTNVRCQPRTHGPPARSPWGQGRLTSLLGHRARPPKPPQPRGATPTSAPPHCFTPPTTVKRCRSPPAQVFLPVPLFPRKEHIKSTPPPCLLSTLVIGATATPLGNRSRHRRFHPLMVSSHLRPSSSSAIGPSSLSVPPSCYRSTPWLSSTTGACRRRGNAITLDRFSASPPSHHLSEHLATSPCPAPSWGPLRARQLDLDVSRSPSSRRRAHAEHSDHSVGACHNAAGVGRPERLGRWAEPTVLGHGPKARPALCNGFSYFPFPFIISEI
jgi:hypothetical protein